MISTCRGCRQQASPESAVTETPRDSISKSPPTESAGKGGEATATQTPKRDLEPENDVTYPLQDLRENPTENVPRERTTENGKTTTPSENLETRAHNENATDLKLSNETARPIPDSIPREGHDASTNRANLPSRSAALSAWEATILVARSNGTQRSGDGVGVEVVLRLPREVIGGKCAFSEEMLRHVYRSV